MSPRDVIPIMTIVLFGLALAEVRRDPDPWTRWMQAALVVCGVGMLVVWLLERGTR